jgi:hypothetical protein
MRFALVAAFALTLVSYGGGAALADGLNDPVLGEPVVQPSPSAPANVGLPGFDKVLAFAVSATSSRAALVAIKTSGAAILVLWSPGSVTAKFWPMPAEVSIDSLAWHPVTQTLFAAGSLNGKPSIFALDLKAPGLAIKPIWQGAYPLGELLVGPRPFSVSNAHGQSGEHRLFFTEHEPDGETWIRAVGEYGDTPYVVAGRTAPPYAFPSEDNAPPDPLKANFLHLIAFHPDGAHLYVRAANGCADTLNYLSGWQDMNTAIAGCAHPDFTTQFSQSDSMALVKMTNVPNVFFDTLQRLPYVAGTQAFEIAPSGLTALEWSPGTAGIIAYDLNDHTRTPLAPNVTFLAEPRVTADGRGLVGITDETGTWALRYTPIALPLADVADAWAFLGPDSVKSYQAKRRHLLADAGFFTDSGDDQINTLYDTEQSACGGAEVPLRPLMITTDAMWEVYAAAYEGLFGMVERQRAIPAFSVMVKLGKTEFAAKARGSRLALMFAAAADVLADDTADPEAARILAHQPGPDPIVPKLDDGTLAPRGFYTDTPELSRYFEAFHYLTSLHLEDQDFTVLRLASPDFRAAAENWRTAYGAFIAASRAPDGITAAQTPAAKPGKYSNLFPLSFGADNDILYNTVYDRVTGDASPSDRRLLGSGLDVAAVLNSATAWLALEQEGEFSRYPSLQPQMKKLAQKWRGSLGPDPLYDPWLAALRVQWGPAPQAPISGKLWDAKRLQTGLASWATLRHATVLVNEVTGAECGGPSPEQIIPRPPRGYVEPDPATFEAIAGMFSRTATVVGILFSPGDPEGQGIIRRLDQSRDDALNDARIAELENAGQPLSDQDYAAITTAAQQIGYNFQIFLSLARDDDALVAPDPIQKITEISGESVTGWREAAVGDVLEWDQIIPDFGHHDIVKGGAYSYFEFTSAEPLDDAAWRSRLKDTPNPAWIAPFIVSP